MSNRVAIRSNTDNHILFRVYKNIYPQGESGKQPLVNHRHAELEISVILNGSGIYNCNGQDYSFEKGDVFFIAAMIPTI